MEKKMQNIEILERSARDWQPDYQPSIYAEKYCELTWYNTTVKLGLK